MNTAQLRQHVIEPTLKSLNMHSDAAARLLMGTAAQESQCDPFCCRDKGLGIYQISSQQHRVIWDQYLAFRPDLASLVRGLASQHQFLQNPDQELVTNLAYSTAIAWIIYLRSGDQLPDEDDSQGLGHFWHHHFDHRGEQNAHRLDMACW